MRALWYSWAKYYTQHYGGTPESNVTATVSADPVDKVTPDYRVLTLTGIDNKLRVGMTVTGSQIPSGLVTILKIGTDSTKTHTVLYLSTPAKTTGTFTDFSFAAPPAIDTYGDTITGMFDITDTSQFSNWLPFANPKGGQSPTEAVAQFAGDVYEVMSVFSTAPQKVPDLPRSMELMVNSFGGNVGFLKTLPYNAISADVRDTLKHVMRGVPDFAVYPEDTYWYPNPSVNTGGPNHPYNIFNLDPFVWFVHKKLGLSGYGFSFDDDAADVGADNTGTLSIAVGGLKGLPNQHEWFGGTPYGTGLTAMATVRIGTAADGPILDGKPILTFQNDRQDIITYHQVKPTDIANALIGAFVSGTSSLGSLPTGAQIVAPGQDNGPPPSAQPDIHEFQLSDDVKTAFPSGITTPFKVTFTGKPK